MGWKICFAQELVVIVFISLHHFAYGLTNPGDVTAINSLHAAFGSPKLPGWVDTGGDPCTEAWQGVQCDSTNIISITLVGANLGGGLGNNLGSFSSIKSIDLSNNHIGGRIPSSLPVSLQSLFLSDNNFTGTIPSTLSSLTNLSTLKLNQNHLTGELPDAYQSLSALSSIDLASNKLSGKLPPSMKYLSSLSSLHLQDNQLSGTLDVLQDLPLQDLNIENNQFSGPIPDKLLNVPNFRRDGNPFNTSGPPDAPMLSPPTSSTKPSPPTSQTKPSPISQGEPAQSPFHSGSETPGQIPAKQAGPPSTQQEPHTQNKTQSPKTKKIVGISIASMFGFIILTLALLLCMPRCFSRSREYYLSTRRNEIRPYLGAREDLQDNASLSRLNNRIEEAQVDSSLAIKDMPQAEVRRIAAVPKPQNEPEPYSQMTPPLRKLDSELSFGDIYLMPTPPPFPPPQSPPRSPPPRPRPRPRPPPPPPPPPSFSAEKAIVKPLTSVEAVSARPTTRTLPLTSVKFFTIASLQQYTNSFSQDNLIGSGMLGSVYRAELPDGKLLAVKKLDKGISSRQKDHEFIELINDIDRIRHVNIVQLVSYCAEHRQRLLIYEYCNNGTLQDALHSDDEFKKHLSWTTRMRMALGAARALEYLHDSCEPAVVHRNFKSANILLDDELNVRLSDCGLASLIASGSVSQLSGHLLSAYGYGAPEFESGIYTKQSDVYSFGVVMLELLTGRMSYERTRIRGEQFLVRWAVPQLHDIDALHRMVDPSLNGQYPTKSLSHFADIISRCVQSEPEFRPLMSEVVQDIYQMLLRGSPPQGSPAQGSPPEGSFRE